jgi:hypothetical protein
VGEETAAGAEELNCSVKSVSAAAVELSEMSQELQELVQRFKVEGVALHGLPSIEKLAA